MVAVLGEQVDAEVDAVASDRVFTPRYEGVIGAEGAKRNIGECQTVQGRGLVQSTTWQPPTCKSSRTLGTCH